MFESYVKVAYSKANFCKKNYYQLFESYVKVAYSKAIFHACCLQIAFESYVKNMVLRLNSWHCLATVAYGYVNPLI